MNIHINKEEHEILQKKVIEQVLIGSQMYGIDTPNSDTDYLCWITSWYVEETIGCPSIHQFQYKDVENNIDYVYTTELQFAKNFMSGDSTINVDLVLFQADIDDEIRLKMCRTYKIIKSYLGMARRDLKHLHKDPSKRRHIVRGIYCAGELLDNKLPTIKGIQDVIKLDDNLSVDMTEKNYLVNFSVNYVSMEKELRQMCNTMYEKGELENYYIPEVNDPLLQKLLNANNIREFRYE